MKLFNKLNEQLNVNRILNKEITEAELSEAEKNIIFSEDGTVGLMQTVERAAENEEKTTNPSTKSKFRNIRNMATIEVFERNRRSKETGGL